ncbi:MAG: transporter substrate-binding domain-containing protein [Candidatus Pacebacteria bacterium]|nr:transporter substrate-binding domain-containing protein [Candidatus Paceibacterota bacterium]
MGLYFGGKMKLLGFVLLIMCIVVVPVFANDGVVASGHPDWAPVMYQDGGKIIGTAPTIVTKVFDEMGIPVDCRYSGSWADVQELGKSGNIDVIVAAYKTEERQKYFVFSDAYLVDNVSLFTTHEVFPYKGVESLVGNNIAVLRGDSYGQGIDDFLSNSDCAVYDNPEDAFTSLLSGQNDGFLYASDSGKRLINDAGYRNIQEFVIAQQPFYMMISKKSSYAELLPKINNLLQKYKAE